AGLRVLVVDDNATNRNILHRQVLSWRMRNGCACSGEEALTTLRRESATGHPYEIVILDLQMPEMDGLMLAKTIKADPAIAHTRLVLLSSLGQRLTPAELREHGIVASLVKPVRQSELFNALVTTMAAEPAIKKITSN